MSFALTADVVLLTVRCGTLAVLLVERANPPFAGMPALPGGFVDLDEDIEAAARRELEEETGIAIGRDDADAISGWSDAPGHLEQLRTYATPGRDPRGRTVTVAYLAMVPDAPEPRAGDDAAGAHFVPVARTGTSSHLGNGAGDVATVERAGRRLAFDHDTILRDGVERARSKLEYTTLATAFVNEPFTLADLRNVYEAVWGVSLHEANFRRKVLSTPGFVEETGDTVATAGRPARLYRGGSAHRLHPPILRPDPLRR